jgi:DNA-binding protein H-NS
MHNWRFEAIAWVRDSMEEYGLTLEDVLPSTWQTIVSANLYRSAEGDTWNEEGPMPIWVQRAVNAGQSPEHFGIG